jgi:hypothetical protein
LDDQRDRRGPEPHVWAPPDAGASPGARVGDRSARWRDEPGEHGTADADGPPPPPWERQRRTRRHWLIGIAAAVLLAVPAGFALASLLETGDDGTDVAADDPTTDGAPDAQDPGAGDLDGDDRPLDAPDLDLLEGADAIFAQLLIDIDASEQAMLGFQREIVSTFEGHGFEAEVDELLDALAETGAEGAERLGSAREPLEQPVQDVRADTVREVYLEHLDSWVRYMRAVEEDPAILATDPEDGARFTLTINATADAFARSLEDQLPDDADPEVQRMAEQLLDRGFRAQGDADV